MQISFFKKSLLLIAPGLIFLALSAAREARAGWKGDIRVNIESAGKQACRGADCPWSIAVDKNNRVHVVWEDRRQGNPLRIYYRGKDPDPTWLKWDAADHELSLIDSVELFGHPSISPQPNGRLFSVFVEERPFGGELYGSWVSDHPSLAVEANMVSHAGGNYLTFSSSGWQTTIAVSGRRSVTFWPYVDPQNPLYLPIFYRIYENDSAESEEEPILLPELAQNYRGVHLSACAGSNNKVYLVCRLITDDFPCGHIYLFTLNILSAKITAIDDLTSQESAAVQFPYIAVMPDQSGQDRIFVAYEIYDANNGVRAAFETNYEDHWTAPIPLSDENESSGRPCLAVNGNMIDFVYESPCNQPNTQIFHRRYNLSNGALSDPIQVTNSEGFFNKRPVVASDSYGNLHLVYITNREHPEIFGDEEVYYSIWDAPPAEPTGIRYDRENYTLTWDRAEPDIDHYLVNVNGRDTVLTESSVNLERLSFNDFVVTIETVDLSGQESRKALYQSKIDGLRQIARVPKSLIVGNNYPNPFNSSTTIPIAHSRESLPLFLEIFDITGRVVKTFIINNENTREVVWNGRNDYAMPVTSGIYYYRLRTEKQFGNTEMMTYIK